MAAACDNVDAMERLRAPSPEAHGPPTVPPDRAAPPRADATVDGADDIVDHTPATDAAAATNDAAAPPTDDDAAATPPDDDAAPPADDVAEQEQAQLWSEQRARPWHARGWLRALAVLAVLAGAAAIIPYPLRITAECAIIPSHRAKVRSELPGVLSEVLVDEGQQVKRGDVIARLDDRALQAERQKLVAELAKIEAELATLRQGHRREELEQQAAIVQARRAEVGFAAKEAARRSQMEHDGVGSPQAAEAASRELETRRQALAEAEAALRLLQAGTRPEEISAHEALQRRAQAELTFVDQKLQMTTITAPIDGAILTPRLREHVHEAVEAGGLVCELASTRQVRAEILAPEREVDAIALGMPARVKVESYPTHPFEGKVDFIAPAVEGDDRRLRVVVELDNAAGLLKANMTGYGEIEAGDHSLLHLATRRLLRWIRVRYLL